MTTQTDTRTDSQKYLDYASHALAMAEIAGDRAKIEWFQSAIRRELGR